MVCGSGATCFGQSISRGNQRIPEERRCLVEYINYCCLLRPVIGEQLQEWPWWGGLSSSKLHNHEPYFNIHWVTSKIHNTYSTSTYNFNWPMPRTHASAYCFNLRTQLRISSTGPCHALKTRIYTSTDQYHRYKYVPSTRFFLAEYVELTCFRIRILSQT